jgi:hypothetical protein
MQNKVFVGFVSLILLSGIHKTMMDEGLYSKMTMKKLIMVLSKLKLQFVKGVRVLFPITKEQRGIYEAFGIQTPNHEWRNVQATWESWARERPVKPCQPSGRHSKGACRLPVSLLAWN